MSERERRWESRRQRFSDAGQRSVAQAPPPAPPKSYEERQQQRDAYAAAVAAERAALQQRVQAADDDRRARDDRWALEARPPSRDAAAVRVAIQKAQEGINAQAQVTASRAHIVGHAAGWRRGNGQKRTGCLLLHPTPMCMTCPLHPPTALSSYHTYLGFKRHEASLARTPSLTHPHRPTCTHPPTLSRMRRNGKQSSRGSRCRRSCNTRETTGLGLGLQLGLR